MDAGWTSPNYDDVPSICLPCTFVFHPQQQLRVQLRPWHLIAVDVRLVKGPRPLVLQVVGPLGGVNQRRAIGAS